MEKIQLLGSEEDLDEGYYAIMTSGESFSCFDDEVYLVNENTIKKLREEKIKFKYKENK